ncbi:hypothetical protein ALC53_03867 [Atta colombica]|uniref:Uncharacterized protein n=1 Tax=Atta colombica TaxID=520822 RepID=A0A195BLU8_9HYME|nr:hypothetical protein ALC53_03867 [Atta colombica]
MDSAKCDSSHEDKSASASHGPDVAALYARSRKTKGHSGWNFSAVLRGHPSGRRRGDPSWLERVTITGKHVLGINYHPNARNLKWYFTNETLSRTRMMLSLVDADRDNPRRHVVCRCRLKQSRRFPLRTTLLLDSLSRAKLCKCRL